MKARELPQSAREMSGRKQIHGYEIREMPLLRPAGRDDVILHTLKHFLNDAERWERVEPRSARTPQEALNSIRQQRLALPKFGPGRVLLHPMSAVMWWDTPARELVLATHDEGYYPRYCTLVALAGSFVDKRSLWIHTSDLRSTADVDGYRVVGELIGRVFQVISAHPSSVVGAGTKGSARLVSVGHALEKKLQDLARHASQEDDMPRGTQPGAPMSTTQRLMNLRDQTARALDRLKAETSALDATVFLDRLARAEAFPEEELSSAGISEFVAAARAFRSENQASLGDAANSGLDLEQLKSSAYSLAEGSEPTAAMSYGLDCVVAANIEPWLPSKRRAPLREVLRDVSSVMESNPEPFIECVRIAQDLVENEHPRRVRGVWARRFVDVFLRLDELADEDALAAARDPSRSALEALDQIHRSHAAETPPLFESLLPWTKEWVERMRSLLTVPSLPAAVLASSTVQHVDDYVPLATAFGGEFVLVRERMTFLLEWHPETSSAVSDIELVLHRAAGDEIPAFERRNEVIRWVVATGESPAGLRMTARCGHDSVALELPEAR